MVVDLGGSDDAAHGVVVQNSGAIVVAGGNAGRMVLLRFRPEGTPDPTFGTGGQVISTTTGAARALLAQPNGKLLAVSADATRFWVSRYSADGQPDPAFGVDGKAPVTVGQGAVANALALQADAKIVVVGGRSGDVALARFNVDGSPDIGFGTSGLVLDDLGQTETAYSTVALASGALVVVGEVDAHHGFHAVYTGTGQRDPSAGGPNRTIALRSIGPVWGGGLGAYGTDDADDFAGFHLSEGGRLYHGLSGFDFGRPAQSPTDVVVQADGRVVVMGTSNSATALVRYNVDGTRDPSFGVGGLVRNQLATRSFSVVIQSNGRIVVSGMASTSPTETVMVGFRPDGQVDRTFGASGRALVHVDSRGSGNALLVLPDGKLLVGGGAANGQSYLARFLSDGTMDTTFGTNGTILDRFPATGMTAQGMSVDHLAAQGDGKVLAVDTDGVLHRFDIEGVADPSFGGGGSVMTGRWFSSQADALALQPDGKILLGGRLYTGGRHTAHIIRYNADGSRDDTWTAPTTIFDNAYFSGGVTLFRALAVQRDGKIVATGSGPVLPVARYLPDGTLDPTFYDGGKLLEQRAGDDAVGAVIVGGTHLLVASVATSYPDTGFMFSRISLAAPAPPLPRSAACTTPSNRHASSIPAPAPRYPLGARSPRRSPASGVSPPPTCRRSCSTSPSPSRRQSVS